MWPTVLNSNNSLISKSVCNAFIGILCIVWNEIKMFLLRCMECRRDLAMRILSVRLSNACIVTKRKKDVYIFILYETSFSLVFWEECLVGATPSTDPRWSEIADFEPIFARSASAITPIEKSSIDTNRKYTACFPVSLRWSSYAAPKPQRGLKNAKWPISV